MLSRSSLCKVIGELPKNIKREFQWMLGKDLSRFVSSRSIEEVLLTPV